MAFLSSFVERSWGYPPVEIRGGDFVVRGDDPDLLKEIGIGGAILHTPGHTQDSISIVLSDGRAFVGDAAMNFVRFYGTRYRPIYAEDFGQVPRSWRKLLDHEARVVYSAHGPPFPADQLKRQVQESE